MAHTTAMLSQRVRTGLVTVSLAALLATAPASPALGSTPTRAQNAEKYALSLLNCTRTGGWVTAAGRCRARGTGEFSAKRAPLKLSKGISGKVAWPWARTLTIAKDCAHSLTGEPVLAERFASNGYEHGARGENIGCGWGGARPKQVVLSTHRGMQAERSYRGGHWRNMKDPMYKSVGIGVATHNGRTTVVYDFYGKHAY